MATQDETTDPSGEEEISPPVSGPAASPTEGQNPPSDISELARKVAEALGDQAPERQGHIAEILLSATATHSGPLPDAATFVAYERNLPGSGNRIISMAEVEQAHRHALDKMKAEANIWLAQWGLRIAAVVVVAALIGGCVLVALDKSSPGLSIIFSFLGTVVLAVLATRLIPANRGPRASAPPPQRNSTDGPRP